MQSPPVNNRFYDELGDRWFEDDGHPIALLRAEGKIKLRYVLETLRQQGVTPPARILDIGCGAGIMALPLAEAGYRVTGVDQAQDALAAARRRAGPNATFVHGDAYALGEPEEPYDVVLLLDVLEHVDRPEAVIAEAARQLRPGGLMIFHTFNRTLPARLLAVHAVQLLTRDAPDHVHVHHLFLKPTELTAMAGKAGITVAAWQGLRPRLDRAFWGSVVRRRIDPEFDFAFTRSLAVGYVGYGSLQSGAAGSLAQT